MRSKAEGIHQPLPVASKSASVPRADEAGPVVLDTTGPRGEANQARKDGNAFLASGVGIGAFGVVSGALLGAVAGRFSAQFAAAPTCRHAGSNGVAADRGKANSPSKWSR